MSFGRPKIEASLSRPEGGHWLSPWLSDDRHLQEQGVTLFGQRQRTEMVPKATLHALEVSGELHVLAGLGNDARLPEVENVFDELRRELDDGAVSENSTGVADGANLRPCEPVGDVTLNAMQVQGEVDVLAGFSHDASFSNFHDVVHELTSEGDDTSIDGDDAAASNETHSFPREADGGCSRDSHHRCYYDLQKQDSTVQSYWITNVSLTTSL